MLFLNKYLRYIGYIIAFLAVVIIGLVTPYNVLIPLPWPFGFAFIGIIFFMELLTEIWRGKSSHVISNIGHYSVCGKLDIHHVPFHDENLDVQDEQGNSLSSLTLMFLGGIDYIANIRSGPDKPVFIFPSIYEGVEESCYHVYATLKRWEWKQLSPYIRTVLSRYGRRITPGKTPIYYGITSHINASATPKNIKLELKDKKSNELISSYETIIDKYFDLTDKDEKRKTRNIWVKEKGDYNEE